MKKPEMIYISPKSPFNSSDLNTNFSLLANAIAKVLAREGESEENNEIIGNIDVNLFRLKNVADPVELGDAVPFRYLEENFNATKLEEASENALAAEAAALAAEASAAEAEGYAAGLNLPSVTGEDADKLLIVNSDGTGYALSGDVLVTELPQLTLTDTSVPEGGTTTVTIDNYADYDTNTNWTVTSDVGSVSRTDGTIDVTVPDGISEDTTMTVSVEAQEIGRFPSKIASVTITVTNVPEVDGPTIQFTNDEAGWPYNSGILSGIITAPASSLGVDNIDNVQFTKATCSITTEDEGKLNITNSGTNYFVTDEEVITGQEFETDQGSCVAGSVTKVGGMPNGILWDFSSESYLSATGGGSTSPDTDITLRDGTVGAVSYGFRDISQTAGFNTTKTVYPSYYSNSGGWTAFWNIKTPTSFAENCFLCRQYFNGPYVKILSEPDAPQLFVRDYGLGTGDMTVPNQIPPDTHIWIVLWSTGTESYVGWVAQDECPTSLNDFPVGNYIQGSGAGQDVAEGAGQEDLQIMLSRGALGSGPDSVRYVGIQRGSIETLEDFFATYNVDISSAGFASAPTTVFRKIAPDMKLGYGVTGEHIGPEEMLTMGTGSTKSSLVFESSESIKDKIFTIGGSHNTLICDAVEVEVTEVSETSNTSGVFTTTATLTAPLASVPTEVKIPNRFTIPLTVSSWSILTNDLYIETSQEELPDNPSIKRLALQIDENDFTFKDGKIETREVG